MTYLVFSMGCSSVKKEGNLRVYNINGKTYKEYNFETKRWKGKRKKMITERENAILTLAQQGKTSKEIADILCKGQYTIRNQIKSLFLKLEVHSMKEAIEQALCHHIVSENR